MNLHEYAERLKKDDTVSAFLEADRQAEIRYLEASHSRFERILRSIPAVNQPLRLLDIGTTPFTLFLKETFPHYDVWTVDRTDHLQQRCHRAGVRLKACDLDEGVFPFDDGFFDVVVFTEVLEHIFAPPTQILAEVRRIMSPSARLILGVPNIARLSERIKLMFGRSPLPNADHQMNKDWLHGHGHLHEYTRSEILGLCRAAQLKTARVEMLAVNPWDMLRGRMRFRWKQFLYYSIVSLVPPFRGCIHVECSK